MNPVTRKLGNKFTEAKWYKSVGVKDSHRKCKTFTLLEQVLDTLSSITAWHSLKKSLHFLHRKVLALILIIFRWFEVGCAIWAQASQIGASQIKAPMGNIYPKYVYSSLMVKMRINFWSFGSFWVGDNAQGRNLSNLNFWVLKVKKFKFRNVEKMGYGGRNVSVSQKVQIFCKGSILVKCSILYGSLRGSIWFLEIFTWFLSGAKVRVEKSFSIENLKIDIRQFFQLIYGYCCEAMYKRSIWSNLFYLGVC